MPKQFQLKIADPCHEDWEKMTTSEKGKFCGSCQKQVVDFTGMTDTQLAAYFKKPSSDSTCGRFFGDQLERKITVPRKDIPWIKYFFQFTLPLFLASCTGNRTKGKVLVETVQNESTSKKEVCTTTVGMILPPVIEEVQTAPIATMGDVDVVVGDTTVVESPDTSKCRFTIEVSDKKEALNNSPADSLEPRAQFTIKEADVLSVDPKFFRVDEINTPVVSQEFKGFLGGFIVKYDSDTDDELDVDESEETIVPESEPGFRMYANPARANSNVFIDAKKAEEGMYAIQLLNFSGQLIKQDQARIEKGMGTITFSIPTVPSGTYMVVLLNKKTGKRVTEKLIVQ